MGKVRTVAVLLFEGVNAVDVSGPLEAFAAVRDHHGGRACAPLVWSIGPRVVRSESGDEAGGIQVHTPLIDRQGIGRLGRGRFFFRAGEERAEALGLPFRWRLKSVPNVGHDFRAMSRAAARLLY